MNMVVDVGNTTSKVGIFQKELLQQKEVFRDRVELQNFLSHHSVENIIVSSVDIRAEEILSWSRSRGHKIILGPEVSLPIRNFYATPSTLGVDRIAAVCGAALTFPALDCLVIDAGTCVNYEFINKAGEYRGGAISPGLKMRFDAMHRYTAKLPVATPIEDPPLTGNSTESCLQSGVMNGLKEELAGTIQRYKSLHPDLRVILCGGDAHFFENHLNPSIFVAPDLVLIGLNSILLHNVAFTR